MLNALFKEELALIADRSIRAVVVDVLNETPRDYGTRPASRTGKNHPLQHQGHGGLARHVKAATYFCDKLTRSYGLIDRERDYCLAAVILHDIGKCFCTDATFKQHDKIGHDFVLSVLDSHEARIIAQLVLAHSGIWGSLRKGPIDSIYRFTKLEQVVHISDYVSSQTSVIMDFLPGVVVYMTSPVIAEFHCLACGKEYTVEKNCVVPICCNSYMTLKRERDRG